MAFAVRLEHVSKRYLRGGPRYRSLGYALAERTRRMGLRLRGRRPAPRGTLALRDVSFELPEGESLGLIGPNGSGKTTALKLITRISYPTEGRVLVRGRVAALIEVGSGVHMELTGRENIWLYGRMLGMSKDQVRQRFDEIVDFAEVGHALDRQVKMYSSGMQLRLGFAVASHLEPEVFLVDEALAVGDADFQQKCIERMSKLVADGRSLIFVSHDLSAVQSICSRGIFLLDGTIREEGPVHEVVSSYLDWVDVAHQARQEDALAEHADAPGVLWGFSCHGGDGEERYAFRTGEDVEVRLRLDPRALRGARVSLGIRTGGARRSLLVRSTGRVSRADLNGVQGEAVVGCTFRALPLLPGIYEIWGSVKGEGRDAETLDFQPLGAFRIAEGPPGLDPSAHSAVHVEADWRLRGDGAA